MNEQNLLELAKQGNPKAIEALINRYLQPKDITAKANLRDGCLIIMLESSQVLEQQTWVAFIQKWMTDLSPEYIKFVKIYGLHIDEEFSDWYQDIKVEARGFKPFQLKSTSKNLFNYLLKVQK